MNSPDNVTRFTLVWEKEWQTLTKYYAYDVEIQVAQLPDEDQGRFSVITIPEVCTCCLEERLRQEEEGKFLFSSQIIYLFKLYSVLPMDQNLTLDGRSLTNVEATLQDLKVYPQCVIFLK
ncbi:ubiquitin carboxyl-terminal hydrolase, partial [Plakobranchus ocellatus]